MDLTRWTLYPERRKRMDLLAMVVAVIELANGTWTAKSQSP
jgi:hypothetical protein